MIFPRGFSAPSCPLVNIPSTALTRDHVLRLVAEEGEPSYRADQLLEWIYKKRAGSYDAMSNLPQSLRAAMATKHPLPALPVVKVQGSADTTRKFLLRLNDGRLIETVLIPASPALYGERSDRLTLCVSSQVGCAYACAFCASGLAGFTRNLSADEIAGQIMSAEAEAGARINNIVFMGMGEPLANLKNLSTALEIINSPWGLHIGARHLTISTSGIAPAIEKLAAFPAQIRLAVSLHGATDEVRGRIMPVNHKWNIERLFKALQTWRSHKKQRITLEYILIKDVNDALSQAEILATLAESIQAKVNLIPYNTVDGLAWSRPPEGHCQMFRDILTRAGVTATLRIEKGHDIDAACGQLRLKEEAEQEISALPGMAGG